ncbi:MAG: sn-glycerol-1-phosphate dehydrogenase [Actinomycetota bacterium]|nr:sn-glycerol-1-phosphate dehydrogenase [Actinomycetota bacterium]
MNDERIAAALQEATDTRNVTIGPGALASVNDLFGESFGGRPAVVVADENTLAVAGEQVQRYLKRAGRELEEPYIFPGDPTLYAEYGKIEKLVESLGRHEAIPVAVGSGTLNDIVKRASHERGRPYMCVGTAASMDGYTAFGASIEKDGLKQTLACSAPRAFLADLDVLVNAPPDMTASGYADLLGKVTSGADWLVADALGVEPIDPSGWSLVQNYLREWTGQPRDLHDGDQRAMEHLIEGLVMSGLGMQYYQSSRTASGAEHQFSHLWDMEGLGHGQGHEGPPPSHGFKVGVGSVAIAALYERILERDLGSLDIDALRGAWPGRDEVEHSVRTAHTSPELEEGAVEQSLAKYVRAEELAERLRLLRDVWPDLRVRLADQLMPAEQIREKLRAAGCPTKPTEIGLGWEAFKATYSRARTIRKRYTALDLAAEAGVFDECVEELFSPGGFWGREAAPQPRADRPN